MKYSVFLLLFPIFLSCSKENNDLLEMRVKNTSGKTFSYSFSAGKEFGTIQNGSTTAYKVFESIVAYPGASLVIEGETIRAGLGYCGTPPIPMLSKGKYTLEIFEDNSVAPGFLNAKFIKNE